MPIAQQRYPPLGRLSCPTNADAGHDDFTRQGLLLLDGLHHVGGLELRGFLDGGETARLRTAADFERFGLHVLNFHFCVEVGGRARRAHPFILVGWLLRDQNRPRPQPKRFRVEPCPGLRARPPRAEDIPEAGRRGCMTLGHGTLPFGAYLAF